jgi:poly(hydroxyalkanoate) depolymerase family esterase
MESRTPFVLILVAIAFAFPPAHAGELRWSTESSTPAGVRRSALFLPSEKPRGLLVMLHGCNQSVEEFADLSRMSALAEVEDLAVLYPEQASIHHPARCWNWFNGANQTRWTGESFWLRNLIARTRRELGISRERTAVAGLSAGGAMAAILAVILPDEIGAAAIHSGLPFQAALDSLAGARAMLVGSEIAVERSGYNGFMTADQRDLTVRTLAIHGSEDEVIHPVNSRAVIEQALVIEDWKDDHTRTHSVRETPNVREEHANSGERLPFETARYGELAAHVTIQGLGHAWSGSGSRGPDASRMIVEWAFPDLGQP